MSIALRLHVLIPDAEDDLNWHAFLGHSIDMQGFRAAEFVGIHGDQPGRYGPPELVGTDRREIFGPIDPWSICTRHVERVNSRLEP